MRNVAHTKDTAAQPARSVPFFWLESTLASYEVEELDGHQLAKMIPLLAVGTDNQTLPEAAGSGLT